MAETIVITCDVCGKPAVTTVTVKYDDYAAVKDVCQTHLDAIFKGTRKPTRGRRRGIYA